MYWTDWQEFSARFGTTTWRKELLRGLRLALDALKKAGCKVVYIDGSFVSNKPNPGDYDACWDPQGVDPSLLDAVLLTFDSGRASQKAKYRGELFIAWQSADRMGTAFFEFFQIDKDTGATKGIVAIDLEVL